MLKDLQLEDNRPNERIIGECIHCKQPIFETDNAIDLKEIVKKTGGIHEGCLFEFVKDNSVLITKWLYEDISYVCDIVTDNFKPKMAIQLEGDI